MATASLTEFKSAALVPELIVRHFDESLYFWKDLLGFGIAYERPQERFAYLQCGDAQVMLEERDENARQWITGDLVRPFGRGINLQITVASIAEILTRLRHADWPLYMDVEEKWYRTGELETGVRQFIVQDPDGYLIRLSQSLGRRPQ